MSDSILILESRNEQGHKVFGATLPNIRGKEYVFGSEKVLREKGVEFFLCGFGEGHIDPIHFIISVCQKEGFCIRSATDSAKAVLNHSELVKSEPRPLNDGDIISFIFDKSCWWKRGPVILIRQTLRKIVKLQNTECDQEYKEAIFEVNPLDNHLILSKILDYLPIPDLKVCRLICKSWREEATLLLEKKGTVTFHFNIDDREDDRSSTKRSVNRLHEIELGKLKFQNVKILFFDFSFSRNANHPTNKKELMTAIETILNSPISSNFTSLFVQCEITSEFIFSMFQLILEKLGSNLVNLELDVRISYLPAILPPLPEFSSLRVFKSHPDGSSYHQDPKLQECFKKWASHFLPLVRNRLERLITTNYVLAMYLQECRKERRLNPLREIETLDFAEVEEVGWNSTVALPLLLELQSPLSFLAIKYCPVSAELNEKLLPGVEELLEKHAVSLKRLHLHIGACEIKLPSFRNLNELVLTYDNNSGIRWKSGEESLNYREEFPSLRKLQVRLYDKWERRGSITDQPWGKEGDGGNIFNAFFQQGTKNFTVEKLYIRLPPIQHLQDYKDKTCSDDKITLKEKLSRRYENFLPRLSRVRDIFPNVRKVETNFIHLWVPDPRLKLHW